jgi:uncharacterized protein (AIM24 family)
MSPRAAYTCHFCGTPGTGKELSCPACGSPTDVARVVSPSGWEELAPIPDLARLQIGRSTCQIEGELVPVADFTLAEGDSVYFAHHVLLWIDPGIGLETISLPGFRRLLAGMPVVMAHARGPGRIAFSHDEPGELVALPLHPGQTVDVREHVLVAATGDVRYEIVNPDIFYSARGTERSSSHYPLGYFMDRFTATTRPGLVLVHGAGNVFTRRLGEHESLLIHPSALLFRDASVAMHLHVEYPVGGGLSGWNAYVWLRVYGPGRVGIRSAYGPSENLSPAGLHSDWTERRVESTTAWYFMRDGQQQGPTTLAYVQGMALVKRLPADTPIWAEGLPGWLPVNSIGLCTKCGVEQPMYRTKWRPLGVKEWIWTIVFLPICFPFMLIGLFMSVRRCTRCGTMAR